MPLSNLLSLGRAFCVSSPLPLAPLWCHHVCARCWVEQCLGVRFVRLTRDVGRVGLSEDARSSHPRRRLGNSGQLHGDRTAAIHGKSTASWRGSDRAGDSDTTRGSACCAASEISCTRQSAGSATRSRHPSRRAKEQGRQKARQCGQERPRASVCMGSFELGETAGRWCPSRDLCSSEPSASFALTQELAGPLWYVHQAKPCMCLTLRCCFGGTLCPVLPYTDGKERFLGHTVVILGPGRVRRRCADDSAESFLRPHHLILS